MSFLYSQLVDEDALVTFGNNKLPRILDDRGGALRILAVIARVESVGERGVSLSIEQAYYHPRDAEEASGDQDAEMTVTFEESPRQLTVGAESIVSMEELESDEDDFDEFEDLDVEAVEAVEVVAVEVVEGPQCKGCGEPLLGPALHCANAQCPLYLGHQT